MRALNWPGKYARATRRDRRRNAKKTTDCVLVEGIDLYACRIWVPRARRHYIVPWTATTFPNPFEVRPSVGDTFEGRNGGVKRFLAQEAAEIAEKLRRK
jgi:hypothetical protein